MPEAWSTIAPGCVQDGIPTLKCLEAVFSNIVKVAVSFVTLALFIMLVIGGFKLLTSGGNPKTTESARSTMTYAIIGLIVIIASYLIMKIIQSFTGVSVTKFEIPTYYVTPTTP